MKRSQWLTFRNTLSNWRTPTQSENRNKVSLSSQEEDVSSSPLLMSGGETVGLEVFGIRPSAVSDAPRSRFVELEREEVTMHYSLNAPIMGVAIMGLAPLFEHIAVLNVGLWQSALFAHPALQDETPQGIGLEVFGIQLVPDSVQTL